MSMTGYTEARKVLKGRIKAVDTLCVSAYAIAVKNGFEGTEEEWLASLVGPKGEKGEKGDLPSDEHITGLIEDNNEVFFADYDTHTLAEILEANNDGKHCVARYANREFHLVTALHNKDRRQEAVFMGLSEDGNSIVVIRVPESWDTGWAAWETETYPLHTDTSINELIDAKVPSDEHIIELVEQNAPEGITEEEVNDLISAKVAGVLTVNFSIGSPTTPASADKTYAEIKEALNSGNTLEGRYNGKSFVYAGTNRSGDISFKQPVYMNDLASVDPQNYGYLITIKSDNNVTFETIAPWGAAGDLIDGIPQADWNQSDSEAKDYLKNKPFYESLEETTVTREFDGESKLFDPDFCELLFEKRSEAVHIVEGTVFSYVGNDSEWSGGWSYSISDGVSTYYVIAMEGSGSSDVDGLVIMTAGGTYKPGSISITVEAMVVHPLDEKYIPDTIARKTDIPSVPASPVVWVNATLNNGVVSADKGYSELFDCFGEKVIMCRLNVSHKRFQLLVCTFYDTDDVFLAFEPIHIGTVGATMQQLRLMYNNTWQVVDISATA